MSTTPRIDVTPYRKAYAAGVAAFAVVTATIADAIADNYLDVNDIFIIASSIASVFGVYFSTNVQLPEDS